MHEIIPKFVALFESMSGRPSIPFLSLLALLAVAGMTACGKKAVESKKGSVKRDSIQHVCACVDETYQPILNQELDVFRHHFPKIDVKVSYKPEQNAIYDMLMDSCKLAFVSRKAKAIERQKVEQDGGFVIKETILGYDALVLIVHKDNPVKKLSEETLKKMLRGEITNWKELGGKDEAISIVFDNPASGTVRTMKDSLLAGGELPANVFSAKTNPEVIRYVGDNSTAIGIIGLAWVSDKDMPQVQEFLSKVDKVAMKAEGMPDKPENYFQPFQTEISLGQYPLSRRMICMNREPVRGPGTEFVYFFASDIGQRILLKAGLLPEFMPPRQISFKVQ
jgi:phosphate transport system substrate-binding protein